MSIETTTATTADDPGSGSSEPELSTDKVRVGERERQVVSVVCARVCVCVIVTALEGVKLCEPFPHPRDQNQSHL